MYTVNPAKLGQVHQNSVTKKKTSDTRKKKLSKFHTKKTTIKPVKAQSCSSQNQQTPTQNPEKPSKNPVHDTTELDLKKNPKNWLPSEIGSCVRRREPEKKKCAKGNKTENRPAANVRPRRRKRRKRKKKKKEEKPLHFISFRSKRGPHSHKWETKRRWTFEFPRREFDEKKKKFFFFVTEFPPKCPAVLLGRSDLILFWIESIFFSNIRQQQQPNELTV